MNKEYKVWDFVYWTSFPTLKYQVKAIIEREKNLQYELECLSCLHSEACRILIGNNSKWEFVFVGMVNKDEDEDEYDSHHHVFHNHGVYVASKEHAYIERMKQCIIDTEKRIRDAENMIKNEKEALKKYEQEIATFTDTIANSRPQ